MEIQELKEVISSNNIEVSDITEEDAEEAYLVSLIKIRNKYDAFYYFASMNLLNAYVKKPYATEAFKKKYRFKSYVVKGIEQIITNKIEKVNVFFTLRITYVSVLGFQFSFHNLNSTYQIKEYTKSGKNIEQEWAGLRLQPAALLIYKKAKEVYSIKNKKEIA